MSDLKDNVAKRYLWNDYAHFELNRDGCDDWRYRAVLDVMKLEQENAELRGLVDSMTYKTVMPYDQCGDFGFVKTNYTYMKLIIDTARRKLKELENRG